MLVPVKGESVAKEYLEIADPDSETGRRFLREKRTFSNPYLGMGKNSGSQPALPWVRIQTSNLVFSIVSFLSPNL